jgi:hypothetical protein
MNSRTLLISSALALTLAACFPTQTFAATSCETAFRSSGKAANGMHFETAVQIAALDTRKAISQLKATASEQGFIIGAENQAGNVATLTIIQPGNDHSRGFNIDLRADAATGNVSIATTLPKGMSGRTEDFRPALCGIIGSVDMARAEVAAPESNLQALPAGVSPADYWAKATKTDTKQLCAANFQNDFDSTNGDSFATWVPTNPLAPTGAVERMRKVASGVGFTIVDAPKRGSSIEMVFYGGKNLGDFSGVPFYVSMDDTLGVYAITAHLEPKQTSLRQDNIRGMMCTLLAAATFTDAPVPKSQRSTIPAVALIQRLTNRDNKVDVDAGARAQLEGIDALLAKAIQSGKAIVVMPVPSLSTKYQGVGLDDPRYWDWYAEDTASTQWRGAASGIGLKGATRANFNTHGFTGAWINIPASPKEYKVFIVEPDTYTITGSSYIAATEAMPQLSDEQSNGRSRLGQVMLKPIKNDQYYKTMQWYDNQYTDRRVTEDFCSAVYVNMGNTCASWGTASYTVKDLTSPAGYREVTRSRKIDGLEISTALKEEFASFTVKPGEVVVVDGFVNVPAGADFNHKACVVNDDKLQCDLDTIRLLRITANPSDIQSWMTQHSDVFPRASQLLQGATYRPVTVKAQKGNFDGTYGQIHSLGGK